MATESSAIARLVNLAQSQAIHDPGQRVEASIAVPPQEAPALGSSLAAPGPRSRPARNSSGGLWLAIVGALVIGGSVTGGYLLAQQQSEPGEDSVFGGVGMAKGALIAPAQPEEPKTALLVPASPEEPVESAPPASDESADEQPAIEPDHADVLVDAELAKKTGFDILVEPGGAKVSLDGQAIGTAPLRVRNLLPGVHGIDIEGPSGYFGKHLEFDLAAGEAKVLNLALDALEGAPGAGATPVVAPLGAAAEPGQEEATEDADPAPEPEHKLSRKEKRKRDARKASQNSASAKKSSKTSASAKNSSTKSGRKAAGMEGADEVSLGTLMLGAKPPCKILINGKDTGLTTPQRSIQLPEGTHRVVLINSEHDIRKSFKVKIKSGRTTRAVQDLSKSL